MIFIFIAFYITYDFHTIIDRKQHIALCFNDNLFNRSSQSLEVVSRYRDPQLQVTENLCYLRSLSPNI